MEVVAGWLDLGYRPWVGDGGGVGGGGGGRVSVPWGWGLETGLVEKAACEEGGNVGGEWVIGGRSRRSLCWLC